MHRPRCIIRVNITKVISLACPRPPPPRSCDRPLKPTKLKPLALEAGGWLSGRAVFDLALGRGATLAYLGGRARAQAPAAQQQLSGGRRLVAPRAVAAQATEDS